MPHRIIHKKAPYGHAHARLNSLSKRARNAAAYLWARVVFAFVHHNYVGDGVIRTDKTKTGVLAYLSREKAPNRVNYYKWVEAWTEAGLVAFEGDQMLALVPEGMMEKDKSTRVVTADRARAQFRILWKKDKAAAVRKFGAPVSTKILMVEGVSFEGAEDDVARVVADLTPVERVQMEEGAQTYFYLLAELRAPQRAEDHTAHSPVQSESRMDALLDSLTSRP